MDKSTYQGHYLPPIGDDLRRIACWGLGGHAQRSLIPAIGSSANVHLVGAWSRSSSKLSEVCEESGIRGYSSKEEMLSDEEVDTVVVSTPTGLHYEHGIEVLKSGKNLWSEKSLFIDSASRVEFGGVLEKSNLEVAEMFMFLYHPQFLRLKSLVDSGELGEIFSMTARFCIPHLDEGNIRYDPSLGGGSLLDAGCYPIASAHALFGAGSFDVSSNIEHASSIHPVDTYGNALVKYHDGVSAFLEWGFGMAYANEIKLRCEMGNVRVNRAFSKPEDLRTYIEVTDSQGQCNRIEVGPSNHFIEMFDSHCSKTTLDWVIGQSGLMEKIMESGGVS